MMRGLGILFIGSVMLSLSIDGRPLCSIVGTVLAVPFLAVLLGYVDVRIVRVAPGITMAATGVAAGLGIATYIPADEYDPAAATSATIVALH